MPAPSPNQSTFQTALRSFLLAALPPGVDVIEGQDSRVSEPSGVDFVVMTPVLRERIETNFIAWADVSFTGAVSGATLNVTAVNFGVIQVGAQLFGPGVTAGTSIIALGSGTGGVGTYILSASMSLASGPLASGALIVTQPVKVTVQLDFHSANTADSNDMVAAVSTLFRSDIATDFFDSTNSGVWPLYADDAKQIPFLNAEQQYETRWVLDACLQTNQAVNWPQQFMDEIAVTLIEADGGVSDLSAIGYFIIGTSPVGGPAV